MAFVFNKSHKTVLKATLNHCKNITLDIDASEVIANKAEFFKNT
jgi:hypothetical protein